MSTQLSADLSERIKLLAGNLSKCPEVVKYNRGERNEAWTLAISFAEMSGSFEKLLYEEFPKLMEAHLSPSELNDTLLDIGEELRHILYHIQDPDFYKYLCATDEEGVIESATQAVDWP
jgi:hypothetical protein